MFGVLTDFVSRLWDSEPTPPTSPVISTQFAQAANRPRTPQLTPGTAYYREHPFPEPDYFLEDLRPSDHLYRTAFLPNTPTKSHQAPPPRRARRGRPKAFRCPNCKCRITITPSGNPSKIFKSYQAPPARPQSQFVTPVKPKSWLRSSRR